jgi:hypothetical protein
VGGGLCGRLGISASVALPSPVRRERARVRVPGAAYLCGLGVSAVQRVFDNPKGVGVNNRAAKAGEGVVNRRDAKRAEKGRRSTLRLDEMVASISVPLMMRIARREDREDPQLKRILFYFRGKPLVSCKPNRQ